MSTLTIKNCGMRDSKALDAAVTSGADYIGFLHYTKSSRFIPIKDAVGLANALPKGIATVAVMVNPDDEDVRELEASGYATHLQLHGDESPERVHEIKGNFGLPIIKAVGVENAHDLAQSCVYADVVDYLLLDTKSPEYGGTGHSFDWGLLKDFKPDIPWFLSGGLNEDNIEIALQTSGANFVDVSSGLEKRKGQKDVKKIQRFNEAARGAYERISR